jgi:hypothetical protein
MDEVKGGRIDRRYNFAHAASATRMPSRAALTMPPA